jgi:hypothetical protein
MTGQEAKWKKGDVVRKESPSFGVLVGLIQSVSMRRCGPTGGRAKRPFAVVRWTHPSGEYALTSVERLGRDDLKWERYE